MIEIDYKVIEFFWDYSGTLVVYNLYRKIPIPSPGLTFHFAQKALLAGLILGEGRGAFLGGAY